VRAVLGPPALVGFLVDVTGWPLPLRFLAVTHSVPDSHYRSWGLPDNSRRAYGAPTGVACRRVFVQHPPRLTASTDTIRADTPPWTVKVGKASPSQNVDGFCSHREQGR
jgi:hypothetical protein